MQFVVLVVALLFAVGLANWLFPITALAPEARAFYFFEISKVNV